MEKTDRIIKSKEDELRIHLEIERTHSSMMNDQDDQEDESVLSVESFQSMYSEEESP